MDVLAANAKLAVFGLADLNYPKRRGHNLTA